jgi:3,2-trans-enoyl-CoA isomerase
MTRFNPKKNESKLGIVAPPWLGIQYIDTIGRRGAERALTLGTLFTPSQALEIDLIDQIADDDVNEAAMTKAKEFLQIPPPARFASKMLIRKERIDDMKSKRQEDLDNFVSFVTHKGTQAALKQYMAQLAAKKK